jgi:hypothetical protein
MAHLPTPINGVAMELPSQMQQVIPIRSIARWQAMTVPSVFTVVVTGAEGTVTSEGATLTVAEDDMISTRSANDPADPTATPPIQAPQNQINVQWRNVAGEGSASLPDANRINVAQNADYPNLWLRLVRADAASNEFRAYWSNNGTGRRCRLIPYATRSCRPPCW